MVPDGWQQTKLGNLFRRRREKGIAGLPTVSVTLNNGLVLRDSLDRKMETQLKPEEHLLVRRGDIAYNMMRMWQGASGLAHFDALVSPAYVVLQPKKGIDPVFAAQLFKAPRTVYLFWAYSYGLTDDRLRLYFQDFALIPVSAPPLSDQRRIGQIFTTWDRAVDTTQRLIAESQRQKDALAQRMMSGKIRLTNSRQEWPTYRLGELFVERRERNYPDLPLLSITRDMGVVKQQTLGRKDASTEDKSNYKRICPGDIGYNTMRMWQGISALSTFEGIVSPAYTIVTPKKKIDPLFAAYLFRMPRTVYDFYRYSQGLTSDTWNLKFPLFSRIRIQLPPLEEQRRIAAILQDADAIIMSLQHQRDTLKIQKQALMQQLLTGKRRASATDVEELLVSQGITRCH